MNRKGFTMIELLAVIVVLGIVLVITFPNMTDVFKGSKLKSEEAFVERISQSIDSYVTLNSSNITFAKQSKKFIKCLGLSPQKVEVYKSTIKVEDIINDGIITENDYKNPGNENGNCKKATEIEVYRDSDYVYCHKIKEVQLNGCLSDEYIKKNEIVDNNEKYIVNTCVWKIEKEDADQCNVSE